MRELTIATGASRKELSWKNRTVTWEKLVNRLQNVTRDQESVAEYDKLSREAQSEKKDKGGFVGGHLKEGRRNAKSVAFRSLITLDADFLEISADEFAEVCFDWLGAGAWLLYSTRKHRPNAPRLRLVLALSRDVTPDEYVACARKLAERLGIERFDPTTYQPERLMYWPSSSYDAEFYFYNGDMWGDAAEYDPATWLNAYLDPTDISEYPISSREVQVQKKSAKEQADPLQKEGIVGHFCRAYSIEEAIEKFLPDVYSQADENRWTFNEGSAQGGLVVYEHKLAFSHHGTDPASGKLCNAFDLVRIHRFGSLDYSSEKSGDSLPSFKAMAAFAQEQPEVKQASAEHDFHKVEEQNEILEAGVPDGVDWRMGLKRDKKNEIENSVYNIEYILKHDPALKGKIICEGLSNAASRLGPMPWDSEEIANLETERAKRGKSRLWDFTRDSAGLRTYYAKDFNINAPAKIDDCFQVLMHQNAKNRVTEYLDGLVWDGVPRLDTLMIDYFGEEDNIYVREAARKSLVACVKRAYEPGAKFDYCLSLRGDQGKGKSYFLSTLGGEFFTDQVSIGNGDGKQFFESISNKWIAEFAEFAALRKATRDDVKATLTRTEDTYRTPYATAPQTYKRACVFFGSANDYEFLNDPTGARRFWPINVDPTRATKSPLPGGDIEKERNQIWAEAKHYYLQDEVLCLSAEAELLAKKAQMRHTIKPSGFFAVRKLLQMDVPEQWYTWPMTVKQSYYMQYLGENPEGFVSLDMTNQHKIKEISRADLAMLVFRCTSRDLSGGRQLAQISDAMNLLGSIWYTGQSDYSDLGDGFGGEQVYKRIEV